MNNSNDLHWYHQIQANDATAINTFITQFFDRVFFTIRRRVSAEEHVIISITHDVLLHVLKKIREGKTIESARELSNYVYNTTNIFVKDAVRHIARQNNRYSPVSLNEWNIAALPGSPEISPEGKQCIEWVIENKVPPEHQRIFHLKYNHGYKNPEIAELLDLKPAEVPAKFQYICRRIRKYCADILQ